MPALRAESEETARTRRSPNMFTPINAQRPSAVRAVLPASPHIVIRRSRRGGSDKPPATPGGRTRPRARVVAVRAAASGHDWLGVL
jgi:hypothetical protein